MVANRLSRTITLLLTLLLFGSSPALTAGAGSISVATAQLLADDAYYPTFLNRIHAAQESIDLVMYLWKISAAADNRPAELAQALGEAGRRGVRIRVILENSEYDAELNRSNRETAKLLQQEGITALFDSPAVTTHAKLAVIDQRYCFVGSHNLTQSALERNHEMSVLIDDRRLAGELTAYTDRIAAKETTYRPVREAPHQSGRWSHHR